MYPNPTPHLKRVVPQGKGSVDAPEDLREPRAAGKYLEAVRPQCVQGDVEGRQPCMECMQNAWSSDLCDDKRDGALLGCMSNMLIAVQASSQPAVRSCPCDMSNTPDILLAQVLLS
jgi:hypothetical protein